MYRLYKYGILLFAFSLPNFESLKYMGLFMMLMGFLGMVVWEKSIVIGKLELIEWLLIAIFLTSVLSTLLNWPLTIGTKGLRHTFCFLTTFWILYKSKPSPKLLIQIAMSLMAGALIGLGWAWYTLFFQKGLSLLSTGVVQLPFNLIKSVSRSGGYAASMLFVSVGIIVDDRFKLKSATIVFSIIFLIIISGYILILGGRGNLLGTLVVYVLLLFPLLHHKKYQFFLMVQTTIAVLCILIIITINPPNIGRFNHLLSTRFSSKISEMTINDQMRYDHWRIAIAQLKQNPSFFGLGPGNFKSIQVKNLNLDPPLLKETIKFIQGGPFHAHNWILTKLVENGIVGCGAFLLFILHITHMLWKKRPIHNNNPVNWTWVASFAAVFIACISGLFNSSFTHENGWLTFLLMGIGVSSMVPPQELRP